MQRAFHKVLAGLAILFLTVTAAGADTPAPEKASAAGTAAEPKVIVALVYDTSCKVTCQLVRPIMKAVSDKYGDKVRYLELNGSKETLKESLRIAKENGIASFLPDAVDTPPDVGIFNSKHKLIKELQGAKTKEVYESAIEAAIQQAK